MFSQGSSARRRINPNHRSPPQESASLLSQPLSQPFTSPFQNQLGALPPSQSSPLLTDSESTPLKGHPSSRNTFRRAPPATNPPSGYSFGREGTGDSGFASVDFNSYSVAPDFSADSFAPSPSSSLAEDMPCRERTAEFRTAAKSLEMKHAAMNGHAGKKQPRKAVEDSVMFNQKAKRIGRDLSQTCAKLEKLALLTKKTSLFNDKVRDIEELTDLVKQDITGLNKQIGMLQEFVNARHLGEAGNAQTRQGRPQTGQHSRSVVVGLQSRLATVSNEFKQVLEERTETLRAQKSRRDKFSQSQPIPSSLPRSVSAGQMGSVLLSDEARAGGAVTLDMDELERNRHQEQVQLIDEQDSYVQARANAMENIESSVVELGTIFKQLADLVQEQGESIQRIDSNVEDTALNVEAAHMELLKYFRSISKNRWLAIKVFGVLIVFFIIFIVFMT